MLCSAPNIPAAPIGNTAHSNSQMIRIKKEQFGFKNAGVINGTQHLLQRTPFTSNAQIRTKIFLNHKQDSGLCNFHAERYIQPQETF